MRIPFLNLFCGFPILLASLQAEVSLPEGETATSLCLSPSSNEVQEAESFIVTIELSETRLVDTSINLSEGGNRFQVGDVPILIPAGESQTVVSVSVMDDAVISRNGIYLLEFSAEDLVSGRAEIFVTDNDWDGFDENGNQMDDTYERKLVGYGADPDADPDGDGLTNFAEDKWGTDPHDPMSFPKLTVDPERSNEIEICLVTSLPVGKRMQIYGSRDMKTFEPIGDPIISNGAPIEKIIPLNSGYQFFRMAAVQSLDTDGDGLTDDAEARMGTDPRNPDSDFDGASDRFELSRFIDLERYALRSSSEGSAPPVATRSVAPRMGERPLPPDEAPMGSSDQGGGVMLFVASGEGSSRKVGIPSYHHQTVGGPITGESLVRVYHQEIKTWREATNPNPVPEGFARWDSISGRWSEGNATRTWVAQGGSYVEVPSNSNEWIGSLHTSNPRPNRHPPGVHTTFGGLGSDPQYDEEKWDSFESIYNWQTRIAAFTSDDFVQGFFPSLEARISGQLGQEFTTPMNIERAFQIASSNLGEPQLSVGAAGFVETTDWERSAEVSYSTFSFAVSPGSHSPTIVSLILLEGAGNGIVASSGNSLPSLKEKGKESLFWVSGMKSNSLAVKTEFRKTKKVYSTPGAVVTFSTGGADPLDFGFQPNDFEATIGDESVEISWMQDGSRSINITMPTSFNDGEALSILLDGESILETEVNVLPPNGEWRIRSTAFISFPFGKPGLPIPIVNLADPISRYFISGRGDAREFDYDSDLFRIRQDFVVKYIDGQFSKEDFTPEPRDTEVIILDEACLPVLDPDALLQRIGLEARVSNEWTKNQIQISPIGVNGAVISLRGAARTRLGFGLLGDIDWCYDIFLNLRTGKFKVIGANDNYPSYELYLNRVLIHEYEPEKNDLSRLYGQCEIEIVKDWADIPR